MITTADIKNILYKDCKVLGINVCRDRPQLGSEGLQEEMIILHTKRQTPEKHWKKSFVEVNLCVPDLDGGENEIRTQEIEHLAIAALDNVTGVFNKTRYKYGIESEGIENDTELQCHYVNLRILFEVLNTI